jgi:transposase-like protein
MQRSQALKPIYTAVSEPAALAELEAFEASPWGRKYPTVVQSWRRAWEHVTPFTALQIRCQSLSNQWKYEANASPGNHSVIEITGRYPPGAA